MSTDPSWQIIKDDFSQLLRDEKYTRFHPLLQKLQQWSSARRYPAQIFVGFIEIIRHMQDELAEGRTSIQEVIDQTISGTFIQPDWEVNSVFQTNGHIFQFILGDFRKEIEPEISALSVPVPIILLVMNSVEAEELRQGILLDRYPEEIRHDFDNLQSFLDVNGVTDWVGRYGATSQAWQPFSDVAGADTIELLITNALSKITGFEATFAPAFIDIRTINDENNRRLLRELRQEGCVVIMDSISLRHPLIQREFHRSALDAYPNTSVVSIAPIHSAFDVLREMTIVIQIRISDMEFAKRRKYDDDEDYGICEELCDGNQFKRWFIDRVKKLSGSKATAKTGIRAYMFNELENTK